MKQYSYLALGDSYTIGEQMLINNGFPYQTVQLLRKSGILFLAPEIIAVTGFTTNDLAVLIGNTNLLPQYDFVSLLIGVNNQYQEKSTVGFAAEFECLLQKAVALAGNNAEHVFVLSIPDWGVTPFAADRDRRKIAAEIDAFNEICKSVSEQYKTHFIDITYSQRKDGSATAFLAADQLHPSGNEYAKWASLLSEHIMSVIKKSKTTI